MSHWNVNIIDRKTKEKSILESGLTEKQAECICESWGWMYTDEHDTTYWLESEEIQC